MKSAITITIGAIALIAALMCVVVDVRSDVSSDDRKYAVNHPTGAVSKPSEECRPMKLRLRERHPDSEFLRHLSKIEPITDFQEPSDGYFQAYLKVRSAENLRD